MCSAAALSIFLLVLCWSTTNTVGLPIARQELGKNNQDDIIAGMDFLSMLMRSSAADSGEDVKNSQRIYKDTTTPSAYDVAVYETDRAAYTPVVRGSRSSSLTQFPIRQNSYKNIEDEEEVARVQADEEEFGRKTTSAGSSVNSNSDLNNKITNSEVTNRKSEHLENVDAPRVIEIRVSSSVGQSLINKKAVSYVPPTTPVTESTIYVTETPEDSTISVTATEPFLEDTTTETVIHQHLEETLLTSEDHPSIIAESNKSEFSIEESEPITRNTYNQNPVEYAARVQPLPSPQSFQIGANPDYLAQQLARQKSKIQPYHQTVIYHNTNSNQNGRDPTHARSVSYSTVIQAVPNQNIRKWEDKQTEKPKVVEAPQGAVAESKDFYVTSKYNPGDYNESIEKQKQQIWDKPELESTSKRHVEPTERNWGIPEKRYGVQNKPYRPPAPPQKVQYQQPEQNYEVDEAVSVMTNGRAHGVQAIPTVSTIDDSRKQPQPARNGNAQDDNGKVGYVVEGRNFRKYQVEERTSDGFIVGEYGVVSHDDGSLRGVRYTADGTISPRLIYDALMKFLSL